MFNLYTICFIYKLFFTLKFPSAAQKLLAPSSIRPLAVPNMTILESESGPLS